MSPSQSLLVIAIAIVLVTVAAIRVGCYHVG